MRVNKVFRLHEVEKDMVCIDLEYILEDKAKNGYEGKENFELWVGWFVCLFLRQGCFSVYTCLSSNSPSR